MLNIWSVVNKNDTVDGEDWTENVDIVKVLDILSSYPNEYWNYPVVVFYLQHSEEEDFDNTFLNFLRKLFVELISAYLEIPTINAVKSSIMKLNLAAIESSKPKFEFKSIYMVLAPKK